MAPRSSGTPQAASGSLHKFLRRSGTNGSAARRGSAQLFASLGSEREVQEVDDRGGDSGGGGSDTAAVESLVDKRRPWPERFAPGAAAELAGKTREAVHKQKSERSSPTVLRR